MRIEVFGNERGDVILIWDPATGVKVPEAAKPDPKARYFIEQRITTKWSSHKEGYLADPLGRRAAEWHDTQLVKWAGSVRNNLRKRRFLPARDEIGKAKGSYTLRVPAAYRPDGSWGLILETAMEYREFLPQRLRESCDKYKLLYAAIEWELESEGEIWKRAAHFLDCIATLRTQYSFSPARTMLTASTTYCLPGVFLGTLYPEIFGIVALQSFRALPIASDSMAVHDWLDPVSPLPLSWMSPEDWKRNARLGQRWLMTSDRSFGLRRLQEDVQPAWSAIGVKTVMIAGPSVGDDKRSPPKRCLLADMIDPAFSE